MQLFYVRNTNQTKNSKGYLLHFLTYNLQKEYKTYFSLWGKCDKNLFSWNGFISLTFFSGSKSFITSFVFCFWAKRICKRKTSFKIEQKTIFAVLFQIIIKILINTHFLFLVYTGQCVRLFYDLLGQKIKIHIT